MDAFDSENTGDFWDSELTGFGVRVLAASKYYALRYTPRSGKRTTMKIGDAVVMPLAVARSEAKKILGDVESGGDPYAEKQEAKAEEASRITLRQFLYESFKPWCEATKKTGTVMTDRLLHQPDYLLDTELGAVSQMLLERWRKDMLATGAKQSTANRYLAYLSSAYSRAIAMELVEKNPCQKVKRFRENNQRIRFLADGEIDALMQVLELRDTKLKAGRDRGNEWRRIRGYEEMPDLREAYGDYLLPAVIVSLHTGARMTETLGMQWVEISFENRQWTIPAGRSKAGKPRVIPLSDTCFETLTRLHTMTGGAPWVFLNGKHNGPVRDLRHAYDLALAEAGIAGVTWHTMRHTFATRLLMNGTDIETVRQLTGHADLTILLRYLHTTSARKVDAVKGLDQKPVSNIVSLPAKTANKPE